MDKNQCIFSHELMCSGMSLHDRAVREFGSEKTLLRVFQRQKQLKFHI